MLNQTGIAHPYLCKPALQRTHTDASHLRRQMNIQAADRYEYSPAIRGASQYLLRPLIQRMAAVAPYA